MHIDTYYKNRRNGKVIEKALYNKLSKKENFYKISDGKELSEYNTYIQNSEVLFVHPLFNFLLTLEELHMFGPDIIVESRPATKEELMEYKKHGKFIEERFSFRSIHD